MAIQEIKAYFDAAGGKKGVKDRDPIWSKLIAEYNRSHQRGKLYASCGSCRATAYKWLVKITEA
jgi:hypothetical protein